MIYLKFADALQSCRRHTVHQRSQKWCDRRRRLDFTPLRNLRLESLEPRLVLSADLVISEFLASNANGLRDFEGDDTDWVEILNRGPSRVDMQDWYLTDNATDLTKWQVPVSTVIEPNDRLVLFASGKDLIASDGEPHTNFKLDTDGEFLALVNPSGTIVHSYFPVFPPQTSDVSYGIDEDIHVTSLVTSDAIARAVVPTDDSLGTSWTGSNEPFHADATWTDGTNGIGYETDRQGPAIAAPIAYWNFDELLFDGTLAPDARGRYDGTVSGATLTSGQQGKFGEALSFDGDNDYLLPGVIYELVNPASFSISLWFRRTADHAGSANGTNHSVNNVLIAQSSNTSNDNLEIGTEADAVEFYLDTVELGGGVSAVSQPASIQNDRWHHLVVSYDSGDDDELKLYVDGLLASVHGEYGGLVSDGGTSPFTIGLSRPGGNEWGDFEGLIDEVAIWDVALDGPHATALFAGTSPLLLSGYTELVGLDLASQLQNQNASAYVRIPFTANDPESFELLQLRMQYDDAFVAYINGMEVARSHVTGTPMFHSAADEDRLDGEALLAEEFFIANHSGLLLDGDNILAIQLLNSKSDAVRALVLAELDGIDLPHTNLEVDQESVATAYIPTDSSLGTGWTGGSEPLNDLDWFDGMSGVGYDTSPLGGVTSPPIAYWPLDELTSGGSLAPDMTGNYDGVVSGATLTSGGQGRLGEALSFDGNNDYVLPGVISELVNPSAFAISMWFRRTIDRGGTADATNHSVNNVLIAQSSSASNDNLEIGTEADTVELYLDTVESGGSTPSISQAASIQDDTWHHLVVSYDSGQVDELTLYVDGTLVNQSSDYGGRVSSSGSSPFTIGLSRHGDNAWGDFEGLIDEVAVWDVALDASQVTALFDGTSPLLFGYANDVGLDLKTQLAEPNEATSAYLRVPFTVNEPDDIIALNLAMQYNDAFVAFINGTEIARSNVAGVPEWNSVATSDRPDIESLTPEEFVIPNITGLLQEGQNILAVHVLNASAGADRLLALPQLHSVPVPDKLFSFMNSPTPGVENTIGVGQVSNILWSEQRGFFDTPFDVTISTDTPGTEIRYTLDGSLPTESNGMVYQSLISLTTTTTVRAVAFKTDFTPSKIDTQTYIFLEDVLTQTGDGFPDSWGHAGADYAMDPDVVNDPAYHGTLIEDLMSVPTLSLVMDQDDLFKTGQGIYLEGEDIERAVSAEWIRPDGEEGFQIDAAIQIQGGASTRRWSTDKLSMRLKFKQPFGPTKLEYQFFDDSPVDRFDTLILDATYNMGWASTPSGTGIPEKTQYIKDQFLADLQLATGGYSHHNNFAHIYINGLYWGMYGIHERTDESFAASYFGGDREDYDVIKAHSPGLFPIVINGSTDNYIAMRNVALSSLGLGTDQQYQLLQTYLDVPDLIDYMLVNYYVGNNDWGDNNFYASRSRVDPDSRWRYHNWDAEYNLMDLHDDVTHKDDNYGPTELHHRLRDNSEYRMLFADRAHRHLFNGGLLTPEVAAEIYQQRLDEIDRAIVGESARWGDSRRPNHPYTRNVEWVAERDRLLNSYFPLRTDVVVSQLVDQQLYPEITAPHFDQHGGMIAEGFELTVTPAGGTIYFTLDGSDPRRPGGEISATAQLYDGAIALTENMLVKARAWHAGKWSALNEAEFFIVLAIDVTEINYNPHGPSTEESTAIVGVESDDFEFIEIYNAETVRPIDLAGMTLSGGVEFIFPDVLLEPGEYAVVVENTGAFQQRYGSSVNVLGEWAGKLSNDGEQLVLSRSKGNPILDFTYRDNELWPVEADGFGATLELISPGDTPREDFSSFDRWQGSGALGGSPGTEAGESIGVVINEVLSRTNTPDQDAIELYNPTASPVNVTGWWLSDSAEKFDKFVIPSATISAGGYLVFDENDFNASGDPLHDFALNGANGDQVWLIQPNDTGTSADWLVDQVEFGAGLSGESLGRWPNGTGRLNPMSVTTFGSENSGPRVGPVIISEIMYSPPSPSDGSQSSLLEFVELYNPAPWTVDLAHWEIDGIDFQFSSEDSIGAGQILIVVPFDPVHDLTAITNFQKAYRVEIGSGRSQYLGPYGGRLDNGGEQLTLIRADASVSAMPMEFSLVVEDRLVYKGQAPWPTTANGLGNALHRNVSNAWADNVAAWESGLPSPGSFGPRLLHQTSPTETIIGEVGRVATLTHVPQVILLDHTYRNPVVFAQPASFFGADPVVVRVTDVQSNQFTMFLAEPSNLNGLHNTAEMVSYVVLEAGSHLLSDETYLEVGTVDTNATVGANISAPAWKTIHFTSLFTEDPVVLTQIQTTFGETFLATRQQPTTTETIEIALESEERFGPEHGVETVGYFAMEPGFHLWDNLPALAATRSFLSTSFTHITFHEATFDVVPNFLASLASYHGVDNSHLRFQELETSHVTIKIEEDTSLDAEMSHTYEDISFLAIGGEGSLTASAGSLSNGQTQRFPFDIAASGHIFDLNVHLNLIHTDVGDLNISLESPDARVVELLNAGEVNGNSLTGTVFDDDAAKPLLDGIAPFNGFFQPTGRLRGFTGTEIVGTWTLIVTDDSLNENMGALLDWSLQIGQAAEPWGNLNYDSHRDATDIDLLFANLGSFDSSYDLDADGAIDQHDIDQLVQNIMGSRYGDTNIDQDVDQEDFWTVTMNYDPLDQGPLHGWNDGNFDVDNDVDITDALRVVLNFSPSEFPEVKNLSAGNELALLARITNSHTDGTRDADRMQATGTRNDRLKTAAEGMEIESELGHGPRNSKSPLQQTSFANWPASFENIDRLYRHRGIRQEEAITDLFRDLAI